MSQPKRSSAPPVPCAVWLKVEFTARMSDAARLGFAERLRRFVGDTGIRPVVSPRLIGLHHHGGLVPLDMSLILSWIKAQKEVRAVDFMAPVPTLLQKGMRHE
jgi:hypothetical protein